MHAELNAPDKLLRVFVETGGCSGFQYGMSFDDPKADDQRFESEGLAILLDPASHAYLEGSLIAGTVDDVVEECERFAAIGTDHLVFDLRFRFDDYYDQMELLGEAIAKIRAS